MAKINSPILISVYNRPGHLEKCVESLKRNALSKNSDLFVVSDAAFSERDEPLVTSVRQYIQKINGFQDVIPILRDKNMGGHLSVASAINQILTQFGKLIFLEDDNIVSENFLSFLNDCLDFYKDDDSIFSISAYNYLIKIPASYKYNIYKWQGFSAWGVGLWWNRWNLVDWNLTGFVDLIKNKNQKRRLDNIAEHLYWQLLDDVQNNKISGDAAISYYMIRNNIYSIFPVVSKVRNTGHDGSGEHCGDDELYDKQVIDTALNYQLIKSLEPDERINRVLWKHFRTPLKFKITKTISRLLPHQTRNWIKKKLKTY
jgi:hypothetical protein